MDISKVKEAFRTIKQGMDALSGGPLEHWLTKVFGGYEYALANSKFKHDDKVVVVKVRPNTMRGPIVGAECFVYKVDLDERGYGYWICQECDRDNPSSYWFPEDHIALAPARPNKKEPHHHCGLPDESPATNSGRTYKVGLSGYRGIEITTGDAKIIIDKDGIIHIEATSEITVSGDNITVQGDTK